MMEHDMNNGHRFHYALHMINHNLYYGSKAPINHLSVTLAEWEMGLWQIYVLHIHDETKKIKVVSD